MLFLDLFVIDYIMSSILKVISDISCKVYCDFEYKGESSFDSLFIIELRKGKYILEFVSIENDLDRITREYSMNSNDEEDMLRISFKEEILRPEDFSIKIISGNQKLVNIKQDHILDLNYELYTPVFTKHDEVRSKDPKAYAVLLSGRWGLINYKGEEIIKPQYDKYCGVELDNQTCFKNAEKYFLFDLKGYPKSNEQYDEICSISETNYWALKLNGLWGIVDNDLNNYTGFQFEEIEFVSNQFLKVKKNGKFGIIEPFLNDKNQAVYLIIFNMIFDEIRGSFEDEYILAKHDGAYFFYNIECECLNNRGYSYASPFYEGLALIYDGGYGYMNTNGENIIPTIYFSAINGFQGGISFVKKEEKGKWAAINSKGKLLSKFYVTEFVRRENGFACLRIEDKALGIQDKLIIIDDQGKMCLNLLLDHVGGFYSPFFTGSLTPIRVDSKWGYINESCKLVIPLEYSRASQFFGESNGGYAMVSKGENKSGIIDSQNNLVIPLNYSIRDYSSYGFENGSFHCTNDCESFLFNCRGGKKSPLYLFFDTETTGLLNRDSIRKNLLGWPRLVQLAWVICDEDGQIYHEVCETIIPDGFEIPSSATEIHGITTQMAYSTGKKLEDVLIRFLSEAKDADFLVGHHISFDLNVIVRELLNLGMENPLRNIQTICTMNSSKDYCGIKGSSGLKYPSLLELYRHLYGTDYKGQHNALKDILATVRCFFELKRRGVKMNIRSVLQYLP